MRLRANIFIWVFFATVVPLTALTLAATYYSERAHEQQVKQDVIHSMENLAAEIERHLQTNQELALGMSRAPAVQEFMPVLAAAREGRLSARGDELRERLNQYFEGFQTVLPGIFYLRVLDYQGNTLIKVSDSMRSKPLYESLSGLAYVEQELGMPEFVRALRSLPYDEASALVLPHNKFNEALLHSFPILDYVVPLYDGDQWLGTLTMSLVGQYLDRILDNATRLYRGQLFVVENNPDDPERHEQILYDKESDIRFAQIRAQRVYAGQLYNNQMLKAVLGSPTGLYLSDNDNYYNYYVELIPYSNRLISWVITTRINANVIAAPFASIRVGIGLIALGALLVTLLLTDIGARKIARPICQLAGRLKAYANGDHAQRAQPSQSIAEIDVLAEAFNYMADTLDQTQAERDKAQHMMLQSNKLASIGQMAAGIGHEINNPLNNILSFAKLLRRGLDQQLTDRDETTRQRLLRDLDSLRDEALRASDIVRGVLNFARQVPPQHAMFEVQPWLENTLALVNQAARSKQLQLQVDCGYAGELEGDRNQLQQALINLLLNAIQASPTDGLITLSCIKQNEQLIFRITDQGPGISEQDRDHIFDPFFTTKGEGEGSGLGLSISLGIIEYHQGTLELTNSPDAGATVTVMLPLRQYHPQQTAMS